MARHRGAAAADQEVEVAALVGLQHVLDVEALVAAAVGRVAVRRGASAARRVGQFGVA